MRNNFILLVVGVVGLAILLYFVSPLSRDESQPPEPVATTEVVEEATPVEEVPPPSEANQPSPLNPAANANPPTAANGEVMKIFAEKLRDLGTCLETQNNVPGDELEPNLQTVVDSVRGEWGESVINTEDWMQIEMETPDGEKRRLRVEMDFDSDTQVQRKLRFMAVGKDGQTTPIPVPEDQAVEPSDSLIASLEAGNNVVVREKFERIYFQNGEEIVARQRDGQITELEINKGAKSFKCGRMNEPTAECQCLQ